MSDNITKGILIQDPTRDRVIFIPADHLATHRFTGAAWGQLSDNTVTFTVPSGDALGEEIPPYIRDADADPAVLIQNPAVNEAYFFTADDLAAFESRPVSPGEYDVSFILPAGMELIEELPEAMKGLLQSGENVFMKATWGAEAAGASSSH